MATDSPTTNAPAKDAEVVMASWSKPELFAEIFERHFRAIHRYVARRVGTALADDLAAEAFTVAFERRRSFKPDIDSARPWLFGIASNLIRSNRRAEQRLLTAAMKLSQQEAVLAANAMVDAQATADAALEMPRVARALAELSSDQRDVLLLHYWVGLTHAEIALSLRISPGTVASRLARAVSHARVALTDLPPRAHPKVTKSFPEEDR